MEYECALLWSQVLSTGPYPKLDESTAHPKSSSLKAVLLSLSPKWSLSLSFS